MTPAPLHKRVRKADRFLGVLKGRVFGPFVRNQRKKDRAKRIDRELSWLQKVHFKGHTGREFGGGALLLSKRSPCGTNFRWLGVNPRRGVKRARLCQFSHKKS